MQLDGVPMSDSMKWSRGIPKLDTLEGLYLEFVRLDANALRRMRRLQELRMFFDEWDTSNIATFASMPELQTLYLEPAVEEILQPSMLLDLGQNIRQAHLPDQFQLPAMRQHWLVTLFFILRSLQPYAGMVLAPVYLIIVSAAPP